MLEVYKVTKGMMPNAPWVMLLWFAVPLVVFLLIAFFFQNSIFGWIIWSLIGIMFGLLGAMFVLGRRAEKAAYLRIEGQPGATGAALNSIRRGWNIEQEPVAIDPRTKDMVFRAVGRGGVVLVAEGPANRVQKLLRDEERKTARVLPNVPILLFITGNGDQELEIPLPKLARTIQRIKPVLTKAEVPAVVNRLHALQRVKLPIPKGIDPTRMRPDRKAMRGR
ncbi:DUF4191 domain-containing protein [Micrococcales bacterium 31B]|nr:DUF4191 domain-containing protein [Micrococcales bacterium 31B]